MADPSAYEAGIMAATGRAETFHLEFTPQGATYDTLTRVGETRPEVGPASAGLIAEVVTVANLGREQDGRERLDDDDVRLAFSFFEWLFDGAVRR